MGVSVNKAHLEMCLITTLFAASPFRKYLCPVEKLSLFSSRSTVSLQSQLILGSPHCL